jgi:hypothetical protein
MAFGNRSHPQQTSSLLPLHRPREARRRCVGDGPDRTAWRDATAEHRLLGSSWAGRCKGGSPGPLLFTMPCRVAARSRGAAICLRWTPAR